MLSDWEDLQSILKVKRRNEVIMAIFATKKVTISTSKKGVRISPKGKSTKKKGK